MRRIKDIALYATLCFTIVMLTLCALYGVAEGSLTTENNSFGGKDFADKAFTLFMYSVGVGLSFLLFDIKPLNKVLKRVFHIAINYVLMIIVLNGLFNMNSGAAVASTNLTMLIFAGTFVFIAVYFASMAICYWLRKLDKAIENRDK